MVHRFQLLPTDALASSWVCSGTSFSKKERNSSFKSQGKSYHIADSKSSAK
jgi:hypothetical protein